MRSLIAHTALNGICPYFTMFPLSFPMDILRNQAQQGESVLDPFCGRGTTNFAAHLLGLDSLGVDSNPVATAIAKAKLVRVDVSRILEEARTILSDTATTDIPSGEFWEWAYHPEVLMDLCRFRTAFLQHCYSDVRIALRAILLGALHGPIQKRVQSYFSNQSPRTYAPKPAYATRYWWKRGLFPSRVDTLDIVGRRAERYYGWRPEGSGEIRLGDSRDGRILKPIDDSMRFSWVITSPPYYGMRTYIPDQWLRNWFLGGPAHVDYTNQGQIVHSSPEEFARDLRRVWRNAAVSCMPHATMVIRFGGIRDRRVDPLHLAKISFLNSPWRLIAICGAGTARRGKRQADAFLRKSSKPLLEFDIWSKLA